MYMINSVKEFLMLIVCISLAIGLGILIIPFLLLGVIKYLLLFLITFNLKYLDDSIGD